LITSISLRKHIPGRCKCGMTYDLLTKRGRCYKDVVAVVYVSCASWGSGTHVF
jgi:hypothetical protein